MSDAAAGAKSKALRAELEATLDEIEDRLNVPRRLGVLGTRAKESWEANPVPWLIGAGAAVAVVGGLIAWALSGDD